MKILKDLACQAGVEYIRTRGNHALVRIDAHTTKLVTRRWLETAIEEKEAYDCIYNKANDNNKRRVP